MKKMIYTSFMVLLLLTNKITLAEEDNVYNNKEYGFSVAVPSDWKLYGSGNASNPHRWIIDWGLPKIWSYTEKANIENAITITVLKEEYTSIDDVIETELGRVTDILISKSDITSTNNYKSIIMITKINGLLYKTKSVFFLPDKNAYIVSFTATEGTFNINNSKFEALIQSLKFEK